MASNSLVTGAYRMQPRIVMRRDEASGFLSKLSAHLLRRETDYCRGSKSSVCDEGKNSGPDTTTVIIVVAVIVPIVALLGVLFYLHRRSVKKQRAEDAKDSTLDLDYGIVGGATTGPRRGPKRKSMMFGSEKLSHKNGQLSMDMNLSSPYLLPPGLHGSHDSVHSLTRSFPHEHDPYRPVAQYTNSETGSIRSFNKETGSVYNSGYNSKRASVVTGRSIGAYNKPPPRNNSFPKKSLSGDEKQDPFATPTAVTPPQPVHSPALELEASRPDLPKPLVPEIGTVNMPEMPEESDIMPPPRALGRNQGLASSPATRPAQFELPSNDAPHAIGVAHDGSDGFQLPPQGEPTGLGLDLDLTKPLPTNLEYDNAQAPMGQPQIQFPELDDEGERGRSTSRQADNLPAQQAGGLGVPQQDKKRLSIGFRPLPPDDALDSEDPEYRANRIRSFYKEYFDDSKEPVPALPNHDHNQYYEDYDSSYLGNAPYYDADSNAFVMPYAQPVTRRAMTPPPGGRRGPPGPGPRGPPGGFRRPHGPHGSLGGMSLPGGPRRPRAGSAYSNGPRPGSSASGAWNKPKKRMPPPSALSTLPTPSKLKDDNFAIFNATDFAPPETFRDHAAGRSQSPLGERRAYSPAVPSASPLVTAFDELAALPSPHLLRKSSTFTGLDFAPPKKFMDSDTMSDAGSIRSNRSGISTAQLSAIRGGAGRVSRLPGDSVFTAAAGMEQLKPQWGMRP